MAGVAIATAAISPIWRRRSSLQARLAAYAAGLGVGGGLPLVALSTLKAVGQHQALSINVSLVVVTVLIFAEN